MPELLVEVGCEELPATFVRKAYEDLRDNLATSLREAGVLPDGVQPIAMGTPRRLIVSFPQLLERQADSTKEMRGPNEQAAFKEGQPTPALQGFCRGQGVDVADVRVEGGYVWVTKTVHGRDTKELLSELIPAAIRGLQFEKSMRWGGSKMRFARPIRWLLAAFGGSVVPFEIEGVAAGLSSVGHRFYRPEGFEATTLEGLVAGLRERFVEPDPTQREATIQREAQSVTKGKPEMPVALVEENVFLTEWPTALEGSFKPEFQELPPSVLITAMAKHERFFPVRDDSGNLTNRFVSIRNAGEDDTVRAGNEWVLNARFNDAKFFFDEDKKHRLADFLEKTSGIVFQEKLGTVRQRADRLSALADEIADLTGADEQEKGFAGQAGLYAKADLSTGLVSELSSLQGVVGGEYARREGMPDAVCWAIASHYDLDRNPEIGCPGARTAVRTLIADNLDKLAGYLGLGMAPSGSSDPYGLRRAATTLIEAAWLWPGAFPSYNVFFDAALKQYAEQGVQLDGEAARSSLAELFASRYEALMGETRHDLLEAALLADRPEEVLSPKLVQARIAMLEDLAPDVAFVQTATRPINIVAAAEKKGVPFEKREPLVKLDVSKLDSQTGQALYAALKERADTLSRAAGAGDVKETVTLLKGLAQPINAFFDSTMVMVEDDAVRHARLTLLEAASQQLLKAGDFTKIVIEGA